MTISEVFFSVIALVWGVTAIVAMIVAVAAIRGKNKTLHRRIMLFLVIGGWAFTAYYLLGYRGEARGYYTGAFAVWLKIHGTVATLTLLSATTLAWARYAGIRESAPRSLRSLINSRHRAIGRVTAVFWVLMHLNGIINIIVIL